MRQFMQPKKPESWLTHKGSITDKLKQHTKNINLKRLSHCFEAPDTWDIHHLKLSPNEKTVLHREILMTANALPCWYARTILPESSYTAEKTLFEQLTHTPLGELIHPHPDIHRTQITPYLIEANTTEYDYLSVHIKITEPLWGRLSTFTIRHQFEFYLLEIFLPHLLRF